jgi:hypothetical protein
MEEFLPTLIRETNVRMVKNSFQKAKGGLGKSLEQRDIHDT